MNRILALHGFLGQGRDWDPVFNSLRQTGFQFESFAPSLFAPYSQWLEGEDFHSWARAFLMRVEVSEFLRRRQNGQKNILLGYSLGGRLALHLASADSSLWDHIVLISVHPGLQDDKQKAERARRDAEWAEKVKVASWQDFLRAWNEQPVFAGSIEPQRYEGDFDRDLLRRALSTFSLSNMNVDLHSACPLDRCRWIVGEHDTKFVQLMADLRLQNKVGKVAHLAKAGHRALFDRPEAIAEIVASLKV